MSRKPGAVQFEISELVPGSFHGVTYTTYEGVATRVDVLVGVTSDSRNVDWSEWIVEAPVGTSGGYWDFRQSTSTYYLGAPLSLWTYTREQAAVPIPPSVFLLGAGLIGLAVARRKKRKGQ